MNRGDLQLAFALEAFAVSEISPNYNVAPTHIVPIILQRPPGEDVVDDAGNPLADAPATGTPPSVRALQAAQWGLLPPWAKDPSRGMINARVETVAEKPSFKKGFRERRCIIPASGYFEWRTSPEGKQPYYIRRADGGILAFAGLYGWWKDPAGNWLLTCTILTRAATGEAAFIHDRAPMILEDTEYADWLDPQLTDPVVVHGIIARENSPLTFHPVHAAVGNVRNNSAQNLQPLPADQVVGDVTADIPSGVGSTGELK